MWAYSYLISIFIFAGAAVALDWFIDSAYLKKHWKILIIILCFWLFITFPGEGTALSTKIWQYSAGKTFGIYLYGPSLETIIFSIFIATAITFAVLTFARKEDQKKPIVKSSVEELEEKIEDIVDNK